MPDRVKDIRDAVRQFTTERVEPAEPALNAGDRGVLQDLREQAKKEGLWALGHPKELGGGGLPFLDYVVRQRGPGPQRVGSDGPRHAHAGGHW